MLVLETSDDESEYSGFDFSEQYDGSQGYHEALFYLIEMERVMRAAHCPEKNGSPQQEREKIEIFGKYDTEQTTKVNTKQLVDLQ